MSLADELLADLEEENDIDDLDAIKKEDEEPENEEMVNEEPMEIDVKVSSIRELCKLRDSVRLKSVLIEIEKYVRNPRKSSEMIGNVESDPEYQLIVEANSVAVDVDNEICKYIYIKF